jgi:hypothetical protein
VLLWGIPYRIRPDTTLDEEDGPTDNLVRDMRRG